MGNHPSFFIMKTFILIYSFLFLSGFTKVSNEELICLAQNIYFEARDQTTKGQIAVALVTINRVNSKRFPNSICKVVKQANYRNGKVVKHKCHFSWFCDGLPDIPRDRIAWKVSKVIARAMLQQPGVHINNYGEKWKVNDFLHGATHYHRNDVDPYWNHNMLKIATIGDHVFYIDPYR
jgi:spore germination cell wall hydrolase CwlJ-like protein